MSNYILLCTSKNKESLKSFLKYFKINCNKHFEISSQVSRKRLLQEKISILKSPHVNKTAQEQFQYIYYGSNISIYSTKMKLILLKKIQSKLFPDLKIIVKGICRSNHFDNRDYSTIIVSKRKKLLKKTIITLKTLSYVGQL